MTECAAFVKQLVAVYYHAADTVHIVQDNLSTHNSASLYEAFPPAESYRVLEGICIHYTSKHGSWLNMAGIRLFSLNSQSIDWRIEGQDLLTVK